MDAETLVEPHLSPASAPLTPENNSNQYTSNGSLQIVGNGTELSYASVKVQSQHESGDVVNEEIHVEPPDSALDADEDSGPGSKLTALTEEQARDEGLPPLDFKPFMLKSWFLYCSLAFNCLILGLLITLLFKPTFNVLSQWGYFFIQIFPTAVGTITAAFMRGITLTLSRMMPFILCASQNGSTAGKTILRGYFPSPNFWDAVETGNFTLGYSWALFVLGSFLLGFKASLLNTNIEDGYRLAIVSNWALYPLIAIYSLVVLFMLVVIWRVNSATSTGLRWDPVSLADHLILFRHSDFLKEFEGSDIADRQSLFESLKGLSLRLGYWRRTQGANTTFWHGFGLQPSDAGTTDGMTELGEWAHFPSMKISQEQAQKVRYRSTSESMSQISMYIFTTIAFILCGLFITGLSSNMVEGWHVRLSANLAAFIFQFVLTFIMGLYTAFWEELDLFTRSTQPFMSTHVPQAVTENLLLDYNCALPYIVTHTALTNKHWKVARLSALAPLQRLLPIMVAGSVSVIDNGDYTCECFASLPLFIAIIIWLFAYVILIPYEVLGAGYSRHLPRNYRSIADILSWTYASKMLRHGDLLDVDISDEDKRERWYMQAKIQLACKKYSFGMYKSTTHNERYCFGIDEATMDLKHITSTGLRELSSFLCIRQRSRSSRGVEEGASNSGVFTVSANPRFKFLLNTRVAENTTINTTPRIVHGGQERKERNS